MELGARRAALVAVVPLGHGFRGLIGSHYHKVNKVHDDHEADRAIQTSS